MIKNIILDMGNVLMDYNPHVILDKVCDTPEEKELLYKELFQGPEWLQGDRGEINNSQRFDGVRKRVPESLHEKLKECVEHWDICMKPLAGAKEFCELVKRKGHRIYVLSNACSKFYEYFPKYFPLEEFDGVVVSSDVHMIKPDIGIYQYLLEKYELQPKECLFIDDREENVEGARASGMEAVVFQNNYTEIAKLI